MQGWAMGEWRVELWGRGGAAYRCHRASYAVYVVCGGGGGGCACACACVRVREWVFIDVHMFVYACVCVYVHVYIHVCTHFTRVTKHFVF